MPDARYCCNYECTTFMILLFLYASCNMNMKFELCEGLNHFLDFFSTKHVFKWIFFSMNQWKPAILPGTLKNIINSLSFPVFQKCRLHHNQVSIAIQPVHTSSQYLFHQLPTNWMVWHQIYPTWYVLITCFHESWICVWFFERTSPKGFSASKCDVGNWIFSKSWKFLGHSLRIDLFVKILVFVKILSEWRRKEDEI